MAKQGYTVAVDMWSVGCLTTALLTGKSYFAGTQDSYASRVPSAVIARAAAECNLEKLDDDSAWRDFSPNAKNFVKKLLVLDEARRLTATAALNHRWFYEDNRRQYLDERYKELTKDWVPSKAALDFMEHLDRWMNARVGGPDPGVSRYFTRNPHSQNHVPSRQAESQAHRNVKSIKAQYFPQPGMSNALTSSNRAYPVCVPDSQDDGSCLNGASYMNDIEETRNAKVEQLGSNKRKRTTVYDEDGIYASSGKENSTWISAKCYSRIESNKRLEKAPKIPNEGLVSDDLGDSIRTAY